MEIEVDAETQASIDELLRSGRFESAAQVIHSGVRQLQEQQANDARIRRLVQEGLRSAEAEPLVTDAEFAKHLEARRQRQP